MARMSYRPRALVKLSTRIPSAGIGALIANLINEVAIMPNIKHILFPIDFSERSCGAVPFVESMANHYDASITLFTAMQPMYYAAMGDPFVPQDVDLEELHRDLKERLDSSLTNNFAGLSLSLRASCGTPGAF